jgi:hypothetical protein
MLETVAGSFLVPIWRRSHASLENWRLSGHVKGSLHRSEVWKVQTDEECSRYHGPASRGDVPRAVCWYTPIVLKISTC